MQTAHHTFVAIQQVLARGVQVLELAVDGIERKRLDFDTVDRQRLVLLGVGVADIDDDLARQCLGHFFDLDVLAQLIDHMVDGDELGALDGALEYLHLELLFFVLHAVTLGMGSRVHRNHAAVFGHVLGEIGGTDGVGLVDDVLLVGRQQRAQHQLVGGRVDDRQVRQGLAGYLGYGFASHQRVDLKALGHSRRGTEHHALEGDAHVAVVDLVEDLADHFLEGYADEQHALAAAVLLPKEVCHFHHAQFVGTSAEVEEAEVRHQAATHHLVGGHGRVEPAGHQDQGLLQGAQRVAANPLVLVVDHEQALVADFDAYQHFRVLQRDAGRTALLAQLAAHVAVDVHRREVVVPTALATHRKVLAGQQVAEVLLALGDDVVEVAQGVLLDLQEVGNTRCTGQALDDLALNLLVLDAGDYLEVVPDTIDHELRIQILEHVADVLGELTDEALAHRPALDGDLWEDFDDKFHWFTARAGPAENEGRELYRKLLRI